MSLFNNEVVKIMNLNRGLLTLQQSIDIVNNKQINKKFKLNDFVINKEIRKKLKLNAKIRKKMGLCPCYINGYCDISFK